MLKDITTFARYQFPTIAWGIFIFILCSTDKVDMGAVARIKGLDKLAHAVLFGVFVYLLLSGIIKQHHSALLSRRAAWLSVATGLLYGILIELYQHYYTVGRHADIYDALADLAGCLLGLQACRYYRLKKKRK